MVEWQPIETAPRNGKFLVWIPSTNLPWPAYAHRDDKPWRIYSNAHGPLNVPDPYTKRVLTASHWAPLPYPPSQSDAGAETGAEDTYTNGTSFSDKTVSDFYRTPGPYAPHPYEGSPTVDRGETCVRCGADMHNPIHISGKQPDACAEPTPPNSPTAP